jgi:hypothetical protein
MRLLISIFCVISLGIVIAGQGVEPHFGNGVVRIAVPYEDVVLAVKMSPQGDFVAGEATIVDREPTMFRIAEARQYLWDLQEITEGGGIVRLEGKEIPAPGFLVDSLLDFSLSNDYVALQFATELQVFSIHSGVGVGSNIAFYQSIVGNPVASITDTIW